MVTERADTYIALSSGPVKGLVLYILQALNIHNSSMREMVYIISILYVRKLTHGKVEWLARGCTARE